MRYVISAVALVAALTGCGGESDPEATATVTATATETVTSTPDVGDGKLADACQDVADALGDDITDDQQAATEFVYRLAEINNNGDTETRAALRPLAQPGAELASAITLETRGAFIDALDQLNQTCLDAGSDALN